MVRGPQTETREGMCGICPSGCWIEAELEDGKLVAVRPHRDHPSASRGARGDASLPVRAARQPLGHPPRRIRGESLVYGLDRLGVALSAGSACKAGRPDPSHALLAMGLSEEEAHCSIRLSLSAETTGEEIEVTRAALAQVLGGVDWDVAFVPCK